MPNNQSLNQSSPPPSLSTLTTVAISRDLMARLQRIAAEQRAAQGKRVTAKQLVEEALLSRWPQLGAKPPAAAIPGADEPPAAGDELMSTIIGAVVLEADPVKTVQAIEHLGGTVDGTMGQSIRVRDLAYHFRTALAANSGICTIRQLILDYEGS